MTETHQKRGTIVLNGSYPEDQNGFYRERIELALAEGMVISVDGALALLKRLGLRPHLLLGDFDSVTKELLVEFADVDRVSYPSEKDQTDGELALRYLLDRGYSVIDIFGAVDTEFETDQMLANIFTLAIANEHSRTTDTISDARLVDHRQYIYLVEDSSRILPGNAGDIFSIIPISPKVSLNVAGARWELRNVVIEFGSSQPLRNEFAGEKVDVRVSGTAVVVHRHSG